MRATLESVALLLILSLGFLADGIMEAIGPGGFLLVSAITLTAAEALRSFARIKRKAPRIHADQSQMQETHTGFHKGIKHSHCTTAHTILQSLFQHYNDQTTTKVE